MKLSSGKRIGQSGQELTAAVLFSFFLHVIFSLAAVFLYIGVAPKAYVPPFYEVKLVGPAAAPEQLSPTPPSAGAQPAPPKRAENKVAPKGKKAQSKTRSAPSKKGGMPQLAKLRPSKAAPATERTVETPHPQPPAATGGPAGGAAPAAGGKGEAVEVTTTQQDFKFGWYLALIRDKIGQNWRPPPDAADASARIVFAINRSGWVGTVNLDAEHSKGTFGFQQAAVRAIRASNPFPPLPEDFSQQTLEFSVDLKAE